MDPYVSIFLTATGVFVATILANVASAYLERRVRREVALDAAIVLVSTATATYRAWIEQPTEPTTLLYSDPMRSTRAVEWARLLPGPERRCLLGAASTIDFVERIIAMVPAGGVDRRKRRISKEVSKLMSANAFLARRRAKASRRVLDALGRLHRVIVQRERRGRRTGRRPAD